MAREFSEAFYNSKQWRECRKVVFNEANGICQKCGEPGEEVHHKIHLTPNNISDPVITLNKDNLILLCRNCHLREHNKNIDVTRDNLIFNEAGDLVEKE